MRTIFTALGLATALTATTPIAAQALPPAQNLDQLEAMVIGTLGAGVGQLGGPMAPIDRRMRLAACSGGVQIDPPTPSSVTVRCPNLGWRLRVPLMRSNSNFTGGMAMASDGSSGPAAASTTTIRRGDPVTLIASGASYSISVEATAMEDGNIGNRVRVAMPSKGSTLFAEVVDAGRVRLLGFK